MLAQRKPRKPLKRKISLRDSWLNKIKREGRAHTRKEWQKGKYKWKRGKPLKKVSKAKRNSDRKYFALVAQWLQLPENRYCAIHLARGLGKVRATENHHIRGRAGRLKMDTRFFCPSCRECRLWPHDNARQARALGLLAEATDWNVYPEK